MKVVFKVTSDSEEAIDNILSSLLPHSKFSMTDAGTVIEEFFRTLPIEETDGLYYVFLKILHRLNVVKMYINNAPTVLRREVFEHAILSGVHDIILEPEFDSVKFFGLYSKSFDLNVPTQCEDAAAFLYTICMDKYDELFEKAIPTSEGVSWVNILKQQMEYNLTEKLISLAAATLVEGRLVNNNMLRGPREARKFLAEAVTEVNNRVIDIYSDLGNRTTETAITSLSASKQFDEKNRVQVRDLFYTGIDPIDDVLPIRTQDIVTVVADEGIGKTRLMIDWAYRALMAGINILYVCGETAQIKIKKSIEAAHLYMKYGIQMRWSEIDNPGSIPGLSLEELEDVQVKINATLADLYENQAYGTITFLQSAYYETFSDVVTKNKEKYNIDLVIVDHILALGSNGTYTTSGRLVTDHMRINYLYECEDVLVKECNIAFINTSHPSTQTSADLKAGKTPGARSGAESAYSTRYSSIVCVLNNTPELRKKDIVLLYVTKLRDEPNTSNACVLQRAGYANIHTYDPKYQYLGNSDMQNTDSMDVSALFLESEDSFASSENTTSTYFGGQ